MCLLLNHTHDAGINGIPIIYYTCSTADISSLFRFHFLKAAPNHAQTEISKVCHVLMIIQESMYRITFPYV